MKKLAVLAVAGLMSLTASAANWVLVVQHSDFNYYIDTASITDIYLNDFNRNKGYKQAFAKIVYSQPRKLSASKTFNSSISLGQFDCKSNPKKTKLISGMAMQDGNGIASFDYSEQVWKIVYPDTTNEVVTDFVCSYQK